MNGVHCQDQGISVYGLADVDTGERMMYWRVPCLGDMSLDVLWRFEVFRFVFLEFERLASRFCYVRRARTSAVPIDESVRVRDH